MQDPDIEKTPLQSLCESEHGKDVAFDLLTGEWVRVSEDQKKLLADPAYRAYIARLMAAALQPRFHIWIRNVGRAE